MQLATNSGSKVERTTSKRSRLLTVGEITGNSDRLARQLRSGGRKVEISACQLGSEALERCRNGVFDCVAVAEVLPDMAGVSLLGQIISGASEQPVGKVLVRSLDEPLADCRALMADYDIHEVIECVARSDLNTARRIWSAIAKAHLQAPTFEQRLAGRLRAIEIRRQHDHLDATVTGLMHALRTPLSVVQESVSLVMEGVCGPLRDDQRKFLAQARGGCGAIEHHLDELLSFIREYPDTGSHHPMTSNLVAIVDNVVAEASARFDGDALQIATGRTGDIPRVRGEAGVIGEAIHHLISPMGKGTPRRALSFVIEAPDQEESMVCLKVTKTGPHCTDPVTPEHRDTELDIHIARHLLNTQSALLHVLELSGSCQAFSIDFATA